MLIVVMIAEKVKAAGAKGHYCESNFSNNKLKTELKEDHHKRVEAGTEESTTKHVDKRQLKPAERVRMLQEKLYGKAKQDGKYKFYILYDKMFIPYMLNTAYDKVRSKGGAPGIDGQDFKKIEEEGREKFLNELGESLRERTYKPQAVKRVWMEKANGGKRPLGIPTIRDRVAQTVCKMILEPIFEADFEDSSYGFRPNRSSKDAMGAIKANLKSGKTKILDADLESYFDTIPHDKLMKVLQRRISDPRILQLIEMWLKSPVYEDGQFKGGKKQKVGTPQGGVISPLLANIYMHLIDKMVNHKEGLFYKSGVVIVRYADGFVLMGREMTTEIVEKLRHTLNRMGLKLNELKTQTIDAQQTAFQFLGFSIRYDLDIQKKGHRYWNIQPSGKAEHKLREKLKTFLRYGGHYNTTRIVSELNPILRGWLNYFEIPKVSYTAMSKRRLRYYLLEKLYRFYQRKSQRGSRLHGTQAFDLLVHKFGLIDPTKYKVADRM